ncbi:MAG TPA: T9SS type A sorting domain-containing protein, partial [Puia sp.]
GNMGIVGTPVIDSSTQTIYVVARSVTQPLADTFVQYLHALDLLTGADKIAPVYITATVKGTGDGSRGTTVTFNQQTENQRPGLLLYHGVIFICWASHCDWDPYHGWIMGYDAATLTQKYVYNDSPDGGQAGIWMSGQAPAVDDDGFIYVSTGNGTVGKNGQANDTTNRGESLLKLSTSSGNLKVVDFFTPGNYDYLNLNDLDYGSDGVLLIPNTHLSLSGSKESYLYLIDNIHMGGTIPVNSNVLQMLDVNAEYNGNKHIYGSPAYFQNDKGKEFVYAWAEGGRLKQFPFQRTTMLFDTLNQVDGSTVLLLGRPGAMLSVSSNGTQPETGILWAAHTINEDGSLRVVPGILQAFDASDVSHELWNSNMKGNRDSVGKFAKFVPPTIANGKVYLATFSNGLQVYGLNAPSASTCPNPLPLPWNSADIGNVSISGDVCYNNGKYTIKASGDDIWKTADAFHSVFQPVLGSNIMVTARVVSIDYTNGWAKSGLMFRSNLDPGSPQVFMAITPGNGAAFQNRLLQSDSSYNTSKGNIRPPYWVRITGDGNNYVGYVSPDGISWTTVDSVTLALGNHAYLGLAYSAHNNFISGTSVIDQVSVVVYRDTLSVSLVDFTGNNVNNQYSQLNWITGQELNFDHFEIERSNSSTAFKLIGTVQGKGDSPFAQNYSFQDPSPIEGANYYRLKMVDKKGQFTYSNMVQVNFSLAIIQLYPNPAKNLIYLKNNLNFTNGESIQVEFINPLGQKLSTQTLATAGLYLITVRVPTDLVSGTYFLMAVNSKGKRQAWKIQVKN